MLEINETKNEVSRFGPAFTNWTYFLIGGGIGATVALLFAPKPGRELRGDIADLANDAFYSAVESATDLKQMGADYYERGKDVGSQVLDVVSSGASAIGDEVRRDANEVATIITGRRREEGAPQVIL